MIGIRAQVSLYPLGQSDLGPAIQAVIETLNEYGLAYSVGAMSTTLWGDDEVVWAALSKAFRRAAHYGGAVLQVTISNVCPMPPGELKSG